MPYGCRNVGASATRGCRTSKTRVSEGASCIDLFLGGRAPRPSRAYLGRISAVWKIESAGPSFFMIMRHRFAIIRRPQPDRFLRLVIMAGFK